MTFNDFSDYVSKQVTQIMGEGYTCTVSQVNKNNDLKLTGLSVHKENSRVSPTFYLEEFYEQYENGEPLGDIIMLLVDGFKEHELEEEPDLSFMDSFESVSDRIMLRIVNYSMNEVFLSTVPHRRFLDLAIVFFVHITGIGEGVGSVVVNNDWLRRWNTDVDTLYSCAYKNTLSILGYSLKSIKDVLKDLITMKEDGFGEYDCPEDINGIKDIPMYVLSNNARHYGAACMVYNDVFKRFAGQLDCDLYILPSSVHELIIIPDTGEEDPEALQSMVKSVNETQVAPQEVLSDNIYRFSRNNGELMALYA